MVAADSSAERLIAALDAHLPSLSAGARRGEIDDLIADDELGWHMAFGEHDGRAYLIDTSMIISSDGDAVVAVSRELGGLVVGCGAETTSGSYWLYAADRGQLLRGYMACHADMRAPWSKGDPLPSEAAKPIEDLDGDGLIAILADFGFDYENWSVREDLQELVYNPSDQAPERGELDLELTAFRQSVAIPKGKQPKPHVVRRDGGFDVVTAAPTEKKKGGLFGFLKRG